MERGWWQEDALFKTEMVLRQGLKQGIRSAERRRETNREAVYLAVAETYVADTAVRGWARRTWCRERAGTSTG